jgi:hypothetical protein
MITEYGLDHSDAQQFWDIFAADHASPNCRLQSGSHLRAGRIPIGVARIKTVDPLRAGLRDRGFRLCAT